MTVEGSETTHPARSIYVSFQRDDANRAPPIVEALKAHGHEVSLDSDLVRPGSAWDKALADALKNADAFVYLASANSERAGRSRHETLLARGYRDEGGKLLILAVRLDDAPLPSFLGALSPIEARGRDASWIASRVDDAISKRVGQLEARAQVVQETAERVGRTAERFIAKSLEELERRERGYRRWAHVWQAASAFSLVLGLAYAIWRAYAASKVSNWLELLSLVGVGLLVVTLFAALSKLTFSLGKSYMMEALRAADRAHAISYGQFYLSATSEGAPPLEVKEAFQHWNVGNPCDFAADGSRDFDPKFIDSITKLVRSVRSATKVGTEEAH